MRAAAENNSAVDGYSIFFDDLNKTGSTELPVIGKAAAGRPLNRIQKRGEAVRIFTGAVMPNGPDSEDPDTVLMQEDIQFENEKVIFPIFLCLHTKLYLIFLEHLELLMLCPPYFQ